MPDAFARPLFHRWLATLSHSWSLLAIREGLLRTLPFLLASSLFLFLSVCGRLLHAPPAFIDACATIHGALTDAFPWLLPTAIGYTLATLHRLPQLPVALLCAAFVLIFEGLAAPTPQLASALVVPVALAAPLLGVPILARLKRYRWTRLAPGRLANTGLRDIFNLIVPGCLAGLAFALCCVLLLSAVTWLPFPDTLWLMQADPLLTGPLLAMLNGIAWFFGIHGAYLLEPVLDTLDQLARAYAAPSSYYLDRRLLTTFAYIGGSGATLSLIGALLLFSSQRTMRLLALISLPTALFNVNEILMFGIPLILNPRLLVPFLLTPVVNIVIALLALQAGWIAQTTLPVPFSTPILLNASMLSGGMPSAMLLQAGLVVLGVACYAPFVRAMERQHKAESTIYLKSLDIMFSRLQEESTLLTQEPVRQAATDASGRQLELERMREISGSNFHLEFQPQVSLHSGRCLGCEALLRATARDGRVLSPWQFIQWLNQAGLMTEVDLWVARQAVRQQQAWQAEGLTLPMTVNVTSPTLTTPDSLERLLAILAHAQGAIAVELTEDMLIGDEAMIRQAFDRLRAIGCRTYIDDFGTGYSALSHLYRHAFDAVKLDRSFVTACEEAKGRQVLGGILTLCHALGLRIVVEGVETAAQIDTLRAVAPTDLAIQGWYYSKALTNTQMAAFARQPFHGGATVAQTPPGTSAPLAG